MGIRLLFCLPHSSIPTVEPASDPSLRIKVLFWSWEGEKEKEEEEGREVAGNELEQVKCKNEYVTASPTGCIIGMHQ